MTERETFYKYFHNSFAPNGYNIAVCDAGGDNISHHPLKKEIAQKISKASKEYWSDPVLRENQRVKVTLRYLDPEFYERWYEAVISPSSKEKKRKTRLLNWNQLSEEEKISKRKMRSLRAAQNWEIKTEEEKNLFIKKMICVNNSDSHRNKSIETRKSLEYKSLISDKISDYCKDPEVRKKKSLSAKKQWEREEARKEYSENRKKWHSDPENKVKHRSSCRSMASFRVEELIKNLNVFNIYDLISGANASKDTVQGVLNFLLKEGEIIKDFKRKSTLFYRRIK